MKEGGGGGEGRDTGRERERGGFVLFVLLCFGLFMGEFNCVGGNWDDAKFALPSQ